jgi:hypothetical protein
MAKILLKVARITGQLSNEENQKTMTDYLRVFNKLSSYGVMVGKFNQALYAEKLLNKKDVNGYCLGVCMDWMRRILQGGKPSLQPGEGKTAEERLSRLKQTTTRGFAAYTVAGSVREQSIKKFDDLNNLFIKVGKVTRELYNLSRKKQTSYTLPLPLQKTLNELKNPVKATISRSELETLYEKVCELEGKLEKRLELESEKRKTIPPAALLWGGIVAKMDPLHTGMNSKHGRGQTTRRYAGIGPVAGGQVC